MKNLITIASNMEMPKNCLECRFCTGEYGAGNEKSYCLLDSDIEGNCLKYKGNRPTECPILSISKMDRVQVLN